MKPFDNREVAIRIHRVLERYATPRFTRDEVCFDHSSVDLKRGLVMHRDGRKEELTGLEARLLELFLSRPSQVLSRDNINQALHGRAWSPYDRTIDGHVARLRRKIEPDREAPKLIRSVRAPRGDAPQRPCHGARQVFDRIGFAQQLDAAHVAAAFLGDPFRGVSRRQEHAHVGPVRHDP